jgi:hypothetical protein
MRIVLRCMAALLALAVVPFLFIAVAMSVGAVTKWGTGPIGFEGFVSATILFGLPLVMIFAVHRL